MIKLVNNITNFAVENGSHARGSKNTNKEGGFHTITV